MAVNNPYATYQNNRIQTASPAELTLILYEGAIKYANIALMTMQEDERNIEKISENIKKTENIVDYLLETLNFKYDVAKDFQEVYIYINELLLDANIKKNQESLELALEHLRGMRDTWKEVMKLAKQGR